VKTFTAQQSLQRCIIEDEQVFNHERILKNLEWILKSHGIGTAS